MPLLDPTDSRPLHFVGIAGAGMSGLAELFLRRGAAITGCDLLAERAGDLVRLGATVEAGHDPAHLDGVRAVVVSSAIPQSHPELVRAREMGLPVIRRAEALAEAVSGGTLVGVAGTHGKTTTTVMTTLALRAAGLDPTGVVGGRVAEWEGNLSLGGDRIFVVEADEYDRSFLALSPTVATITNVDADHLDIYRDLADILETFERYAADARAVVRCGDDDGAASLKLPRTADVIDYGTDSKDVRLKATQLHVEPHVTSFRVLMDGVEVTEVALRVPGIHNVRNSLAAIGAGLALGAPADALARGVGEYVGVERRFQALGTVADVTVVDDYAHHPTEIVATLAAAREAFPRRRIVAAFQPHLYSRTRDFAGSFGKALAVADAVYLVDIYPAREAPLPGVTSALIADAVVSAGGTVAWRGTVDGLIDILSDSAREGDVVLTLGAGDITRVGPQLLRLLGAR